MQKNYTMSTTWNSTTTFHFEGKQIRTLFNSDKEPFFTGRDVAIALGYKNPRDALKSKVDEEDRVKAPMVTSSGTQTMTVVNRFGLFSLIFGSEMETKQFKHWVMNELIPYIDSQNANTERMSNAMTPDQRLDYLSKSMDLMERLGELSDRDKELYRASIRAVTLETEPQHEFQPQPQQESTKQRYWSIGDAAQELGYSLSRDIAKRAGKEAASAYYRHYGKHPVRENQVIAGSQSIRYLYQKPDVPMLQHAIQKVINNDNEALKDYGLRAAIEDLSEQNKQNGHH